MMSDHDVAKALIAAIELAKAGRLPTKPPLPMTPAKLAALRHLDGIARRQAAPVETGA
jgi:hypothetical protein